MRKIVFMLLVLLFAAHPVSAGTGLTISSDQSCAVTPGKYSISVTNEQAAIDTIRITALGAERSWVIFDNTAITLGAKQSGTFTLTAIAPTDAPAAFYQIPITVFSDTNKDLKEQTNVCLIVKRVDKVAVKEIAFTDNNVGPSETLAFTATLENVGTEPFRNVDVAIDVTGPQTLAFAGERVTLVRGAQAVLKRELQIDNKISPGVYNVRVTLTKDDVLLDTLDKSFTVEGLQIVDKNTDEHKGVFVFSSQTTLYNRGNVEAIETVTASVARPFNAFVSAPDAIVAKDEKGVVYAWPVALRPGETKTVSYNVHYWPFYVILTVVIYAAYQFYLTTRRPTIRKMVLSSKKHKDDIQEFAVAIEVKNTTPSILKNVTLRDFAPAVARVHKDFKVQPEKAKFVDVGTELLWKFKEMKPSETRIVHYHISTVVGSVDRFLLPSAIVEGERAGRPYRVHSNELTVGSKRNMG